MPLSDMKSIPSTMISCRGEHKNEIATLPQTMKDADGIILATTVEWLGIGGYMQQFLDACWLYGAFAPSRLLFNKARSAG